MRKNKEKAKTLDEIKENERSKNKGIHCFTRRRVNNQVRRESRNAKINIEKTIAQNIKCNPKIFWKYVQSKTKQTTNVNDVYMNSEKTINTKHDREKAIVLAEYFSSVLTQEPEGEIPNFEMKGVLELSQMKFTCKDICRIIDKLQRNNSPGPEGFHPRVIKEVKNTIAYPLRIIFTLSLQNGKLPIDWKVAYITAIYKKR